MVFGTILFVMSSKVYAGRCGIKKDFLRYTEDWPLTLWGLSLPGMFLTCQLANVQRCAFLGVWKYQELVAQKIPKCQVGTHASLLVSRFDISELF